MIPSATEGRRTAEKTKRFQWKLSTLASPKGEMPSSSFQREQINTSCRLREWVLPRQLVPAMPFGCSLPWTRVISTDVRTASALELLPSSSSGSSFFFTSSVLSLDLLDTELQGTRFHLLPLVHLPTPVTAYSKNRSLQQRNSRHKLHLLQPPPMPSLIIYTILILPNE